MHFLADMLLTTMSAMDDDDDGGEGSGGAAAADTMAEVCNSNSGGDYVSNG